MNDLMNDDFAKVEFVLVLSVHLRVRTVWLTILTDSAVRVCIPIAIGAIFVLVVLVVVRPSANSPTKVRVALLNDLLVTAPKDVRLDAQHPWYADQCDKQKYSLKEALARIERHVDGARRQEHVLQSNTESAQGSQRLHAGPTMSMLSKLGAARPSAAQSTDHL